MPRLFILAAAAVAAVAIGAFAIGMPGRTGIVGGPTIPPASATPSTPTAAPSATFSTIGWQPFISVRYGYTADLPTGWVATPASRDWAFDTDLADWLTPASDHFDGSNNGESLLITAFSVAAPNGERLEDWITPYMASWTSCDVSTPAPTVIDGRPGFIVDTTCDDAEAFTLVDGRVYVFSVWRQSGRPLLEAFLSTVKIPVLAASTWPVYSSTRYTFGNNSTIGYPADWSVSPSDHDWTFDTDGMDPMGTGFESFTNPAANVRVSAWNVPRAPAEGAMWADTSVESWKQAEAWVQAYCERTGNTTCTGIHERAIPLCLEKRDCHPGLLVPFQDDVEAFFTNGGAGTPMTVVAVWRGETSPTVVPYGGSVKLLEAFLSTMDVQAAKDSPFPEVRASATAFAQSAP